MDWRVKATVQKTLGVVPFGRGIHGWLQRTVGGLRHFEHECEERISDLQALLRHLRAAQLTVEHARLVEVGTGWYPALPIGLYLCGASRICTYDVQRHLDLELCRRCLDIYVRRLPALAESAEVDLQLLRARYERLVSLVGMGLEHATDGVIDYRAPGDARTTGLPDGSVDVVFSNNVLEHVTEDAIRDLMQESRRVLRSGGLAVHNVNCGDHYSYFDSTITPLNYLRFSPTEWQAWNNDFLYQNRLRASDFIRLAQESALDVDAGVVKPTEDERLTLGAMKVDPSFARYAPDDLCITRFPLIARNPPPMRAIRREAERSPVVPVVPVVPAEAERVAAHPAELE